MTDDITLETADKLEQRAALFESSPAGMALALVNLPQALREAAVQLREIVTLKAELAQRDQRITRLVRDVIRLSKFISEAE